MTRARLRLLFEVIVELAHVVGHRKLDVDPLVRVSIEPVNFRYVRHVPSPATRIPLIQAMASSNRIFRLVKEPKLAL